MENNKNKPLGILVFGRLNFYFFGLFIALISIVAFFMNKPEDLEAVKRLMSQQGIEMALSADHYKILVLLNLFISLIFLMSGWGILNKKKWARHLTIYFSLTMLLLVIFASMASPALMGQAFLQVLYPVALILYFTGKKISSYFE